MSDLTPLRFSPLFRRYLWGGRRLGSVLGKPLGAGDDYAESWEVVDHGEDQSVVLYGEHRGKTLRTLCEQHAVDLLGRPDPGRFPLLFKLLDANRDLSVQVHPNDRQAAELHPPDLGKTEAWVILAAEPGSRIYAGLQDGTDRAELQAALEQGTAESVLHAFTPEPGDCVFIPAGMVHALGAGLLVAEIQQSSDTTFRLFDWNRVGPDGKPRALHIQQGLEVIDFSLGPGKPVQAAASAREEAKQESETLVDCDKFVLWRRRLSRTASVGTAGQATIVYVLDGAIRLDRDPSEVPLARGQTALLPAACGAVEAVPEPQANVLEMQPA